MSEHRRIWYEAVKANQVMQIDEEVGKEEFEKLLDLHPNDGMVFYERAEAFEALEYLEPANSDYLKAEEKLLFPNWKNVANLGINRIQDKKNRAYKKLIDDQWEIFHLIHGLYRLPHEIRCQSLSSIERFDSECESCIGEFRKIAEDIVNKIYSRNKNKYQFREPIFLGRKIKRLFDHKIIEKRLSNLLGNLNYWGTMELHSIAGKEEIKPNACLGVFFEMLEVSNNSMYF